MNSEFRFLLLPLPSLPPAIASLLGLLSFGRVAMECIYACVVRPAMSSRAKQIRQSYDAKFKLRAVEFAVEHGNRAAGRQFEGSEKLIRDWRKASPVLRTMKSTKKANHGKKARWPELEQRLHTWVLQQRAEGRGLNTVQLRLKAKTIATETNAVGFNGGPSWCFCEISW